MVSIFLKLPATGWLANFRLSLRDKAGNGLCDIHKAETRHPLYFSGFFVGAVEGAEDGVDGGEFDVGVDAGAPDGAAVGVFDLDVGNGAGGLAGGEGVFAVVGDLEAGMAGGDEAVDEGGEVAKRRVDTVNVALCVGHPFNILARGSTFQKPIERC